MTGEGATSGTIRRFHYAEDDTPVGDDLAALVRLVSSGRLHVEIGLVDDCTHTPDALQALLARQVCGRRPSYQRHRRTPMTSLLDQAELLEPVIAMGRSRAIVSLTC